MSYFTKITSFEEIESLWENSQKETLNLEFKADLSSSDEIAKDISSFANSDGGVIIYGLQEDSSKGIAVKSTGIELRKKDERIQQIVSSAIAPELMVRIETIQSTDKASGQSSPDNGFVIVKIPRSELYIHQVTTTGRYYVRNNTQATPYKYDPQELKESDIEYRYRRRFENRKRLENTFEVRLSDHLTEFKWPCYLFLGALPNAISQTGKTIDKLTFRKMLFTKQNLADDSLIESSDYRYRTLSDGDMYLRNKPKLDGRTATRENGTMKIEMNDDGSVFVFHHIPADREIPSWNDCISIAADFLHLMKRLCSELNFYGGVTMRYSIRGCFNTDSRGNIAPAGLYDFANVERIIHPPTGNLVTRTITLSKHFQFADCSVKSAAVDILTKLFASLGLENIEKRFPNFSREVTSYLDHLEKMQ